MLVGELPLPTLDRIAPPLRSRRPFTRGEPMTVAVTMKLKADPKRVEEVFRSHKGDFIDVSDAAKQQGVIKHLFAAGDGEVLIVLVAHNALIELGDAADQ